MTPPPLEVEVVAEAPAAGPSEAVVSSEEIDVLPGALGDPLRALQGRPGVTRAPWGLGLVLLRGTDSSQQGAWLGDVPLPRAVHFGGLGTVVEPAQLAGVTVVPGAPSSRYGGHLGGAVVLDPTAGLRAHAGGDVGLDLLQAHAAVWAPVAGSSSVSAGARRSWLDLALDPFLADGERTWRVPWTQDAHLRVTHEAVGGTTVDGWLLGAWDRFDAVGADSDGAALPSVYEASMVRTILQTATPLARGWTAGTAWSGGPDLRAASVPEGDVGVDLAGLPLPRAGSEAWERDLHATGRVTLRRPAGPGPGADLGAEATLSQHRFRALGSTYREFGRVDGQHAGAWAEADLRLGPLAVAGGGRIDARALDAWRAVTAEPRGRLRLGVTPATAIVASAAEAHQAPTPRQVSDVGGNPSLSPSRSVHVSAGLEQRVGAVALAATGYRTWLHDLVVGREHVFQFDEPLLPGPIDDGDHRNGGRGRVVGIEGSATLEGHPTLAWVSVTLSRSERAVDDGPWEPWAWDQPVLVAAALSAPVARRLRLGGRARAGSGLPYTPMANAIANLENERAFPVWSDAASARLAPFFSLDARADWTTALPAGGDLSVFVDVQNATARANEEVIAWSGDLRDEVPVLGLPILPTAGVRGRW